MHVTAWVVAALLSSAQAGAQQQQEPAASAATGAPAPQQMIGLTTQVPQIGADTVLEARVKSVSSTLRCPVCQGLSLQDSPSELAQQMRGVVREQLAQGKSDDDVRQYFIAKYGDWILLKPKASGFAVLVYALPALLVVLGGAGIWVAVKKWSTPPEARAVVTGAEVTTAPPSG
jgi:cytochrome c-type biogenesis protein CcmH